MIRNGLIFFVFSFLFFAACKQRVVKNVHRKLDQSHFAHWVNKQALDIASSIDTSELCISSANQLLPNAITEIDIEQTLFDSVFITKKDDQHFYLEMLSFENNHLKLKDSSELFFEEDGQELFYVLSNHIDTICFIRAPEHLMKTPTEEKQLGTFRFMLNAALNPYSYILIDSLHTKDDHNYVSFFANELLRGYYGYTSFHLQLQEESSSLTDVLLVHLKSSSDEKKIGCIYYNDSVELYRLEPHANNQLMKGPKIGTLLKHKWER
jgi:hypothetical protein